MVKSSAKHHKGNVLCNILCDNMRDEFWEREGGDVVFHAGGIWGL